MTPRSLVQQIYDPAYLPEKLNMAEFVGFVDPATQEERQAKVEEQLKNTPIARMLSGDSPKPLSLEEAEAIDEEIARTQQAIRVTRSRIKTLRSQIDQVGFTAEGGQEASFKLDISKRGHLKRAVKSVFGQKTDTITYSMYKAALDAKRQLEDSEANDYVNLKWKK